MAVKLTIYGKVQGVGFRKFVYENAIKLGIKGYVKNNPDGTVEAWFEGDEHNINKIIELCRIGPSRARVEKVCIENFENKGYNDFSIIR
ncbi:MAG: acylphosphatase [Nanopusillaceae archaeon]